MRPVARVALLTALWLLAWGEVSVANVLSGVVVSAGLLLAMPPSASRSGPVRLHPIAVAQLLGYIGVQLLTSNAVMVREVLRPRPTPRHGVLVHRLRQPSEHVVTVMASVIALSPGTMTVDVDRSSSTISVHFLLLHDIDAARAGLERLEQLATRAIGPGRPDPAPAPGVT
jgi:multicomponent Na+:H+ antiporter subunit E